MITLKSHPTLEAIKSAFKLTSGILEITSENKVNFCRNEDDAVIVQIGWADSKNYSVDSELAAKVEEIHTMLNRYLEGGCHDGITMLVLSLDPENNGYVIYGEDADDECEPVSKYPESFTDLIEVIESL